MKKFGGLILSFIISLTFVSAYGVGFGSFGFGNLFSSFNISMYLTALLFAAIFAVIYFILGKSPLGENTGVRWIVSLCASAFAIWGIISSGFSFEEFLFKLGITNDLLPIILWMVVIIIAIILTIKVGFRNFLSIVFGLLGTALIALSLFEVIYEQAAGLVIGIIFLILALIIRKRRSKNKLPFQEKFYKKMLKKGEPTQYAKRVDYSPQAIEKEKIVYQKRQRSIYDLKQKYVAYGNRFNQVSRSNPNEARRILQAMDVIVNMARKQGVKEKDFLSNRYVMNYKSVKEIRRNSGY
ncbi:hypothetical protein J4411_01350 [Candidatus Pacearchaeota archaeon]|nr:hypothetical protein [uncultured archaeon]MBS3084540.1 hypothetical protein [Candidatus Pacearchaeota archaeon]